MKRMFLFLMFGGLILSGCGGGSGSGGQGGSTQDGSGQAVLRGLQIVPEGLINQARAVTITPDDDNDSDHDSNHENEARRENEDHNGEGDHHKDEGHPGKGHGSRHGVGAVVSRLALSTPVLAASTGMRLLAIGLYHERLPGDVSGQVEWTSSNPKVAQVSGGWVDGISAGTVVITARDPASGKTAQITIAVTGATLVSLAVTPAQTTIPLGLGAQLIASGTFSDGTQQDLTGKVTWTVDNPAGLGVAGGGLTTLAQGVYMVTATDSGGLTATAQVTVSPAQLVSIAVTPAITSLPKGLFRQLIATGTYTDGTTQPITRAAAWSSDSPAVTVGNTPGVEGLATAAQVGSAVVTAALNGFLGTASVSVSAAELVSLAVTPASSILVVGNTRQMDATGTYTDGTTQPLTQGVTWTSNNPALSVSNAPGTQGLALGTATGQAVVTADVPAPVGAPVISATAAVTVTGYQAEVITFPTFSGPPVVHQGTVNNGTSLYTISLPWGKSYTISLTGLTDDVDITVTQLIGSRVCLFFCGPWVMSNQVVCSSVNPGTAPENCPVSSAYVYTGTFYTTTQFTIKVNGGKTQGGAAYTLTIQ